MSAKSAFTTGKYLSKQLMTDAIVIHKVKKNMAFQLRSMTHQSCAQFQGHPVSTSKDIHLILTNIHANNQKEEKPMDAKSTFTTGNYHCKFLMTDVILIHRVKKRWYFSQGL